MKALNASSTSLLEPKHQIVVYGSNEQCYIELFDIVSDGAKKVLSEGRPMTKSALKKIMNLVMTKDRSTFLTQKKLMPSNVLYHDPRPSSTKLIWYAPAGLRILHGLRKKPVKAILPAIIYLFDGEQLHVHATKAGSRRPELKTTLFVPPLPNVYDDGHICMGNVKLPAHKSELSELIEAWESAFWGSQFSDAVWSDETKKNLNACIRSKKPFNNRLLQPMKKTLADLIK